MAKPLDPKTQIPVDLLKKRGLNVLRELLDVLDKRAEMSDETFADACSRLPMAWQAVMLCSYLVQRCEEGAPLPEIVQDMPEADDRALVMRALKEMGEKELASALSQAEDVADEDPETWSGWHPVSTDRLTLLKKKLFVLATSMDAPFPAPGG
jgi:hypothetical protein